MKNLVIFASGSGTNAENIARLFHQGNRVRVAAVLCNRKNAGVYARMEALGIPVIYVPNSVWDNEPAQVVEMLKPFNPDLIVLAGFMRAIQPEIINAYPGKIINIHPSLLPKYGGKGMFGHHVHEAVIANRETRSGVTVHYVTAEIDGGEIIMQQEVEISPEDTAETLEAKIHPVEYSLYPRAIVAALSRLDNQDGEDTNPPSNIENTPTPKPKSVDEAWAEKLHLNYDANEVEARKAQAMERAANAEKLNPQTGSPAAQFINPTANGTLPPPPAVDPSIYQFGSIPPAEKPKSHLLVAILITLFCCTIPGIVAIVYGASVSSRLAMGDYEGAQKASKRAEGWIIAGFVLGLLSATVYMPITFFSNIL